MVSAVQRLMETFFDEPNLFEVGYLVGGVTIPSDVPVVLGRTGFATSIGTRDKRPSINEALPILTKW